MKSLTIVIALVASQAFAQAEGLKQFLDAADTQNLDHRISLEQREKAEAEYRQAWTSLLPSLLASATYTHNEKEVAFALNPLMPDNKIVITPYNQVDGILRIDLPLIDTTRWMRMLAASAGQEGALEREHVIRDLIHKQVVATYYAYAATLAMRESAKKSLAVAEAQEKLMVIRAGAGAATELEVLRAKAEVQRNKQVIVDASSLVATMRRTLQTVSGVEPPEQVALPEVDRRGEPSLEELEHHVVELPAVKAAELDAAAAGKLATASKLALVPVIGAQFTERFTNATGFAGSAALYNLGVTASWRIDGPTVMGIDAQAHGENVALLAAERAKVVARDQLHADWQRFNAALQKIDAAEAQLQASTRAAQVARDRYAAGAALQLDVILAEREVFGAEFAAIQAKTDLATARLSLRISAGVPLD